MNPVDYALTVPGWMRDVELSWLSRKASSLPAASVWLEVGTWMGRSWSCVALSLPRNSVMVAVDTFRGENAEPLKYVQVRGPVLTDFMRVHEEVRREKPDLISQIIAARSVVASAFVPDGSCDVIFVDGDHRTDAVLADIRAWLPKLRRGGLMCGHDGDDPEVLRALEEIHYTMSPSERGSIWCMA